MHYRILKTAIKFFLLLLSFTAFGQNIKIDSLFAEAKKSKNEGNLTKSIDLYQQAIAIDKSIYSLHINLGVNYNEIAEFEKAIVQYNIAEKIDNTKWGLYNNKGNAYSNLGLYQLSNENHLKALKMKGCPKDTVFYNIADNFWRMGKLDKAIKYLNKVISYNPNLMEAHSNKAYVYLLKKDYATAKVLYEKLLQKKPNTYNILNNLGYIYLKQGDIDKAFLYVNKSLEINPNNSWGYRNLGLIYKEKSDSVNACINLNKALKLEFIKFWGEDDIKELLEYCK